LKGKSKMMKKVIVTGSDGYCGWPVVLRLLKDNPEWRIYGIDNTYRRQWVSEVGALSVLPIAEVDDRIKSANDIFGGRFEFLFSDITNTAVTEHIINTIKPDIIIHLASQPSAPFSSIDAAHCAFTQRNNTSMLTNIMFALNKLEMHETHLIVTTTTGVYGAPPFQIPEGELRVVKRTFLPYPAMGGSWYHMSRAFDSANMWLAAKQFKFPITELRTAIVCGTSTEETRSHRNLMNRFDIDFYFGVVVNRFIAMALTGENLTVYGKGEQKKPMISLEDMVNSTCGACHYRDRFQAKQYEIFNQMQESVSIVDLANYVAKSIAGGKVTHIDNPRVENEIHKMQMDNRKFFSTLCLSEYKQTIEQSIEQSFKDLNMYVSRIRKETFMR
jgi:nucleoside-diphosphate-sugar epimerase